MKIDYLTYKEWGNSFFLYIFALLTIMFSVITNDVHATFPTENLSSRSLIALSQDGGYIFLSWRVLNTDHQNTTFKIYRKQGNGSYSFLAEVNNSSNFIDKSTEIGKEYTYYVCSSYNGTEGSRSNDWTATASAMGKQYIQINLNSNAGLVQLTAGDVDADGIFDYVAQVPAYIDPNSNETYKLEAYNSFGEFLWRHDTGIGPDPIDLGPIWTMAYIMWDLDNDQKAEVLARIRENNQYFLIAYDGLTGVEKGRIKWPDVIDIYNDRHIIAIGYLGGSDAPPSVILQVGTYYNTILRAYDFTDTGFSVKWQRQGLGDGTTGHGIDIIDYDGDSRDEIVQGATLVDEYGNMVWTTNLGHMDIMVPGDINPDNPGFEIFYGSCYPLDSSREGTFVVGLDNGKILWEHSDLTESNLYHIHGGWAADVTDDFSGWECWAHNKPEGGTDEDDEPYLYNGMTGKIISREWITNQELLFWDDDDEKELTTNLSSSCRIFNFPNEKIVDCPGGFLMIMDVVGDFRDEFIIANGNAFYIYTNTDESSRKKVSPLFDRHYRLDVARSGCGYFRHSSVLYINQNLEPSIDSCPPAPPVGISIISP